MTKPKKRKKMTEPNEPSPELLAEIAAFRDNFDQIKKSINDNFTLLKYMLEKTSISDFLSKLPKRINSINAEIFILLEGIEANLNYWERDKWIIENEGIQT